MRRSNRLVATESANRAATALYQYRAPTVQFTAQFRLHISTKTRSGDAPERGMDCCITPLPPNCRTERTGRIATHSEQLQPILRYRTIIGIDYR